MLGKWGIDKNKLIGRYNIKQKDNTYKWSKIIDKTTTPTKEPLNELLKKANILIFYNNNYK